MTNNKKQNLKVFGMVLGFLWLMIINLGIIMAVRSFFECSTTNEIKLASKDYIPTFSVDYKDGNDKTKTLLPLELPNWDKDQFTHATEINYEGKLNLKKLKQVVKSDLFIKINPKLVAKNNVFDVNGFFKREIKVDNSVLNGDKVKIFSKNDISNNDNEIKIPIKIKIEQLQFFPDNINITVVDLKTIYDIVDPNGNFFQSAESTINVA